MENKNKEGYPDPTAAEAIQAVDKQPEKISWYIKTIKDLADIVDLEVVSYIHVKDKKTKKYGKTKRGRECR